MKNNLKLILLLSSISLTSIASNASNIIDETITSTSTTQEITTATSSSNQIQQEDPINWDLIAKHRESLKNNNENKNIFKIETELTKTQFNELKEYLNTKFTDHPSTKEILEAIQGLEKSNGLNSQNLLLLSLYHTFKINNNHNETVAKMLTERVLKELYYNLTQTEEVKSMLETSKQLAMFRDGAEFAAPYIFYPIFGVGELSIQDITKAFLDHVFPIGIISEEQTSHNVKVSPGQFAFHDFVHGHQSSIYSYPVTALDYADPETEDTKGLDKIILLTASSTNYIYSLHEKLVKQRKYANKLLKDLIKKADQTKLSGQDRKYLIL